MNANLALSQRQYNSLSPHLRERYGYRVFKVSIDAGFTCPNRDGAKGVSGCSYCSSASYAPKGRPDGEGVWGQLCAGIRYVRERHKAEKFVAYFQANSSTYAPVPVLRGIFGEAMKHPDVVALAVSTRPDCMDYDVADLLGLMKRKKDVWLEMGLQTSNDSTLDRINRAHTAADFEGAVKRAHAEGIDVCAHVILGLPGEGRTEVLETVKFLNGLRVWGVKFHQLQVLGDTPLAAEHRGAGVPTLSLEEYTELVVDCLEALRPETIVHRLCGDSPEGALIAPRWGENKFMIHERIRRLMSDRGAWQGRRCADAP